ncbi:hypothetical protein PC116_g23893 [Phytophthora cactorum]|uniref:Uncharacterized protein n=1 Tax=Phytophthora cactorum TaxID=29920 RepID=A0A8T1JTH4_9STRA|nr:hypothetical protein PC114_g21683 [Phytophthora cactorum]KAG2902223.1 hypothetical protein PC117_g21531 [Phytophthora cactorum]KAG3190928.1 hypothetical protein PC128_g11109 [Phytophthora cactorum]KAG4227733.1 hypothetical protein PC116_g23893 [Phytophthora cactorum]
MRRKNLSRAGSSPSSSSSCAIEKAQVPQAAQTASNTQVELVTQVVRLRDRVAALKKVAYAASSSSVSHQG